jgi:NADPH-dependent 7-cyano-7-deazaguanine reductase QueF
MLKASPVFATEHAHGVRVAEKLNLPLFTSLCSKRPWT